MKPKGFFPQALGVIVIFGLLISCGSSSSKKNPIDSSPSDTTGTHNPPPGDSTGTPRIATSAAEILGTWHSGSSHYIRFDDNGTFRQAISQEKLESTAYSVCSYRFEGEKMIVLEISVSGVPSCGTASGQYKVTLLESGNIQIATVADDCSARSADIGREYEPVP